MTLHDFDVGPILGPVRDPFVCEYGLYCRKRQFINEFGTIDQRICVDFPNCPLGSDGDVWANVDNRNSPFLKVFQSSELVGSFPGSTTSNDIKVASLNNPVPYKQRTAPENNEVASGQMQTSQLIEKAARLSAT